MAYTTIFTKTYNTQTIGNANESGEFTPTMIVSQQINNTSSSIHIKITGAFTNYEGPYGSHSYNGSSPKATITVNDSTISGQSSRVTLDSGGNATVTICNSVVSVKNNFDDGKGFATISGEISVSIANISSGDLSYDTFTWDINETIELNPIDLSSKLTSGTNFNDEENPTITYSVIPAASNSSGIYSDYPSHTVETVTIEAAISADGSNPVVPYRQIPNSGTSYTFNLTWDERVALIESASGSISIPIYFLLKTTRTITTNHDASTAVSKTFNAQLQRVFTVVSEAPSMVVDVVDSNSVTLALTGNEDKFIRYHSNGAFTIEPTAGKGAEITHVEARNGSQTVVGTSGTINGVETNTFNFYVVDSKHMASSTAMVVDFVDYVKLTCRQQIEMELVGETGATANLIISGSYYNGSFGAQNNELTFEIRHTQNDGTMGEWTPLLATFEQDGHSYEKSVTISGLRYDLAYTFQCRVTDKLETATTPEYVARVMPVFDWSENDFNFNVPVNINSTLSWQGGSIEAGSWTPECLDEGAISSYTTQSGWYQKMGNVVTVGFMLAGVCGNGFTSTSIEIGGLPYYPVSTGFGGGVCSQARVNAGFNFQCWAATTNGTITARVQACNNTSAGNLSTSGSGLFYSASGTSITLGGTITYLTD